MFCSGLATEREGEKKNGLLQQSFSLCLQCQMQRVLSTEGAQEQGHSSQLHPQETRVGTTQSPSPVHQLPSCSGILRGRNPFLAQLEGKVTTNAVVATSEEEIWAVSASLLSLFCTPWSPKEHRQWVSRRSCHLAGMGKVTRCLGQEWDVIPKQAFLPTTQLLGTESQASLCILYAPSGMPHGTAADPQPWLAGGSANTAVQTHAPGI